MHVEFKVENYERWKEEYDESIERPKIFYDDNDRDNFLDRPDNILIDTKIPCFAWALIPIREGEKKSRKRD